MFDYTKEAGIVITTYSMLSFQRQDGMSSMTENAEKRKKICEEVPWGIVIFDEV
jgi:hypothetical protein